MRLRRFTLDDCHKATGVVVVIDVIRAFTTAAYAFAAGAQEILLTDTVDRAFELRDSAKGSRIMGEVDGLRVEGFDYGNSPSQIAGEDLSDVTLIQRTSAGTQGMVRARNAAVLLGGSFTCAAATVAYLKRLVPDEVGFVVTGVGPGRDGDEDVACADYLTMCLEQSKVPDATPYLDRVRDSAAGQVLSDPDRPEFPAADLQCVTSLDQFRFHMLAQRRKRVLIMRAHW
jgi:2-phosphosulfolactate phosphatase